MSAPRARAAPHRLAHDPRAERHAPDLHPDDQPDAEDPEAIGADERGRPSRFPWREWCRRTRRRRRHRRQASPRPTSVVSRRRSLLSSRCQPGATYRLAALAMRSGAIARGRSGSHQDATCASAGSSQPSRAEPGCHRRLVGVSLDAFMFAAGWSSSVARRAHNPKVAGSNPAPATNEEGSETLSFRAFDVFGGGSVSTAG